MIFAYLKTRKNKFFRMYYFMLAIRDYLMSDLEIDEEVLSILSIVEKKVKRCSLPLDFWNMTKKEIGILS